MTIALQTDAGMEGSGDSISPAIVEANLITIANADSPDIADTGLGEGATVGDLIPVTYTRTDTAAPAVRLDTLINTNFNVNPGNADIVIVGAGKNFVLIDGTPICGNGVTIAPQSPDNPSKSIYVIYDTSNCNGHGITVPQLGGGPEVATPNPVVLYHELSHAFRRATNTTQTDDEVPAINDENVLRPLLGLGLRDPNPPHTGTCTGCAGAPGTGSCCVVASVATGSPYSNEVNALRAVRDSVLRPSEVGFDFFQHLHYDYYGFSPEVCRLMARSPDLVERIRTCVVAPLIECLTLIQRYAIEGVDDLTLGTELQCSLTASPLTTRSPLEIDLILTGLQRLRDPREPLPEMFADLTEIVDDVVRSSEFVAWALFEPIEMYARAWRLWSDGASPQSLGNHLTRTFDDWVTRLPLTPVWQSLSLYALAEELDFLQRVALPTARCRQAIGRRLQALFGSDKQRIDVLRKARYLPAEE